MSWQAFENVMYMSYFLAAKSIPVIAAGSSIVFAISPWQTVRAIQQAKSTLQFPFAPFFFYFIQNVIYTLYAYLISNFVMGATSCLGMVLGSYYVWVYYFYARDKQQPARWLMTAMTIILMLGLHASTRNPEESALIIGVPGNILSFATASSPLLQVKKIIRERDASCLPAGMSIMTVIAGFVWMVYGLMLGDPLVIYPNMFALTMGVIQVTLILLYPAPFPPGKEAPSAAINAAIGRHKPEHEKA